MRDPCPYDGPIARADGARPFNRYLWPTEDWWAYNSLGQHVTGRWHFGIVALADGRWAVEGFVWSIEKDETLCGRRCCFATRAEAIRAAAARLILLARRARHWPRGTPDHLTHAGCACVVAWAREVAARESGKPEPRPIALRPLPEPPRKTGLPLFDREAP